ncbi:N-acetylmuramoyl-L-alanine amidase [Streptomyces sp. NPDC017991]|uniref:N-acetylmuramoyl-L-alanine amidase n=1 Tax=Streptomyces sp. NPDC017991 TaxID=3365026 RepID=UPI0037AA7EA2
MTKNQTPGIGVRRPVRSRRGALIMLASTVALPVLAACTRSDRRGESREKPSAAADGKGIPDTRAVGGVPTSRETQRSPFPMTSVGLSWTGPEEGIRIRFLDASGTPSSSWTPVAAACPCGRDAARGERRTAVSRALVPADDARAYQVEYPEDIDILSGVVMDTVHGPERPRPTPAASRRKPSRKSRPGLDDLGVIGRAEWGADETKVTARPAFSDAQALTVHHTVTTNDDRDPASTIRAIFELHAVQNDWGDIGYHFLVDSSGRVYEGRASGNSGLPAHNEAAQVVTGFHTAGFNTGNIGVALLGDMSRQAPSAAARRSLAQLLATLSGLHDLDPLSEITYVNPVGGARRKTSPLNGHGTWTSTECPGTETDIEELRKAVAEELAL